MPPKGRKRRIDVIDTPPENPSKKKRKDKAGALASDVVSFTGLSKSDKDALGETVMKMGAMVSEQFNSAVTVLVAGHTNTEKVHAALELKIDCVTKEWIEQCSAGGDRLDPCEMCLLALKGFTVILSGFLTTDPIADVIMQNGGELSFDLTTKRSILVVKQDPESSQQEVLSREIVRDAYKQCIPVVWGSFVEETVSARSVSEKCISKHSVINTEPAVPTKIEASLESSLENALQQSSKTCFMTAPFKGLCVYLHKGDADDRSCCWAAACLAHLGAFRTLTITPRTTHIVVASPDSRPLLHQQQIVQIATGGSTYVSPSFVFPPTNVVNIKWIFDSLLQFKRLPTDKYLYSLTQKPQEPRASMAKLTLRPPQPAPPIRAPVQPKKIDTMPPPLPLKPVKEPPSSVSTTAGAVNVEKAQKLFGKSNMFKGKVFSISLEYAKAGKLTACKIILSHGGEVVKPHGDRSADYHVVPHHSSAHVSETREEVKEGVQVITEDWLSLCFNFQKSLSELEKEKSEKVFRDRARAWGSRLPVDTMTFTEAVIFVTKTLTTLNEGGSLPVPSSHFMYHIPIRKTYIQSGFKGTGMTPSPFLQHSKLRTAKKQGIGVAVCFSGIPVYEQQLLAKAVDLMGGKVTAGYDSHVTTHIVTMKAYYQEEGYKSTLIKKAKGAAEKGGHGIVLGVTAEWLAASAASGYFVIETDWVLFPDSAKMGKTDEKEQEKGSYSVASSQPTPVVKAVLKDPETPSPRGCLNFDTVTKTDIGKTRKMIRVCFAVSAKSSISISTTSIELLTTVVEELGGIVVKTCAEATHYVASALITTENTCIAMSSGKWIMSPEWVTASGSKGSWLEEHEYEWSHEMVQKIVEDKKIKSSSKEMDRVRFLAKAVQYWRNLGGGAFRGWNVHVCANNVFASILEVGGANVVSRQLPHTWKDISDGLVLMDKKTWESLSPEAQRAIVIVNSVNMSKQDTTTPIERRFGIFLWIDFISMHLLRHSNTIPKALCGHDPALSSSRIPPIPW
eukprot:TRINITY_DN17479_c0_g2_i1.p1 TRINITY_DN17479_c0_g2~~TRINITY_DN17479_c0_g2_i1.p1  ORF type:complete len:1015 (+),score=238.07 TRINITY_DN17479_c0_g2_i1:46-3090(+)